MAVKAAQATILLVKEDSAILNQARIILEEDGFEVLTAGSAAKALRIEAEFQRPIHLLLSDVVMPGIITGPDLATALKERRQDMRVMLMSCYPDGALRGLNYGWHFMAKPFVPKALLKRVKDILANAIEEQRTEQSDTCKGAANGS